MPIDDDRDAKGPPGSGSAESVPPPGRGSPGANADRPARSDAHIDMPQDDTAALSRLLTALADDTDAPPSSVTAESVLAAARSGQPSEQPDGQSGKQPDRQLGEQIRRNGPTAVPGTGSPQANRPPTTRRRTGLIALVVAASLAGIAAIVIPLTLGAGSATNTASDSASELIIAASGSAASGSAGSDSAASAGDGSGAGNAGGARPGSAAAAESASAAGPAEVSAPAAAARPSDAQADAAVPSAAGAGEQCWPVLSSAAAAALVAALPPGAFAAPVPLDGGCEQDPVAGAVLTGSVPGTELVVRVVKAEPGACARSAGEASSRCVAGGNDRYAATDPSGGLTVFVYGDGLEVSAGSLTSVDGVPSVPTGLSADQLHTAAVAVLATLR